MKRYLIISAVFASIISISTYAQVDIRSLENDYPALVGKYGDQVSRQTAHYIFAIDVSSFMRSNISVLMPLIEDFINALPDGDFITYIRKSSRENTGLVAGIDHLEISPANRKHLKDVLYSEFKVQEAGSDGYKMTMEIVDAITKAGRSDLVFVFMFTDFEYWTRQNGCNKNSEDWAQAKNKLQPFLTGENSKMIFPFAIFFPDIPQACNPQVADYRKELKEVFGGLSEPQSQNPGVLRSFFNQMKINILAFRLKHLVYKDLSLAQLTKPVLELHRNNILAVFQENKLVHSLPCSQGVKVTINQIPEGLADIYEVNPQISSDLSKILVISPKRIHKPIVPVIRRTKGILKFGIEPVLDCKSEFDRLNSIDNVISLNDKISFTFEEEMPTSLVFIHILPFWAAMLVVILVLFSIVLIWRKWIRPEWTFNGRSFKVSIILNGKSLPNSSKTYRRSKKEITIDASTINPVDVDKSLGNLISATGFKITVMPAKPGFLSNRPKRGTYLFAEGNNINFSIKKSVRGKPVLAQIPRPGRLYTEKASLHNGIHLIGTLTTATTKAELEIKFHSN